jgi:hypothetical protein
MKVKGERIKTPAQIHTEKNDRKSSRTKKTTTTTTTDVYVCTFGIFIEWGSSSLSLFCALSNKEKGLYSLSSINANVSKKDAYRRAAGELINLIVGITYKQRERDFPLKRPDCRSLF